MVAARCSLNTVKSIRHELMNCDGDYEAVARRKQHNRRSDYTCTAEFLENLQRNVLEDPGIAIRALSHELNASATIVKLALNEDLHYYSYKCHIGQLLTEKARENRLTKGKKLLSKVKHPVEPQSGSFLMRTTSAKIKSTTHRIIDGLHTVQRTLLV